MLLAVTEGVAAAAAAAAASVVTVGTYWIVNEVARDVEDPFLYEPNGEHLHLAISCSPR
jgi:hypothetical protein